MDSNLKLILSEFEQLKGQFVITDMHRVERLVAIGDDNEDWYYITWTGKELHWSSCCGRIMPLKGYIREEDYDYLIHIAKLNDYDQLLDKDVFKDTITKYISQYDDNHKFETEFCWEIN